MHVAQILRAKGRYVATVGETATVAEAARILKENLIGAVVIARSNGKHIGLISERDIVHGLAAHGAALLGMPVADVMSRDMPTCTSDSRIEELMQQMTERRVRHLPVVDHGVLAGIVSIGDVVKWRLDELQAEAQGLWDYVAGKR